MVLVSTIDPPVDLAIRVKVDMPPAASCHQEAICEDMAGHGLGHRFVGLWAGSQTLP